MRIASFYVEDCARICENKNVNKKRSNSNNDQKIKTKDNIEDDYMSCFASK